MKFNKDGLGYFEPVITLVILIGNSKFRLSESDNKLVINKTNVNAEDRLTIHPAASNEISIT